MKKLKNNMKNIFNSKPKYTYYLYFFIPILTFCIISNDIDNDFYFLSSIGKSIVEHGIPHNLILTIHKGFYFIAQQWLSALIFYKIDNLFGFYGIYLFTLSCFVLIIYLLYKLCYLISKKRNVSVYTTIFISTYLSIFFIRTRPQIFDYILFLLEFISLETYIRRGDKKAVFLLPLISLLMINLHASSYFLLYIFALPYLIKPCKCLNKYLKKENYSLKPIIIALISMLPVAFINPYGIEAIKYIFTSYGNAYINNFVMEMFAPRLCTNQGLYVYIGIFLTLIIFYINKEEKLRIRYLLLYLGTLLMTLMHIKSASFLILCGSFCIAEYMQKYFKEDEEYKYTRSYKKKLLVSLIGLIITTFLIIVFHHIPLNETPISNIIKYLNINEKNNKENLKIYTNYNYGSNTEYNGYKVYLDSRAEAFFKINNKKEDIFIEYYNLETNTISKKDFLEKYKFDYLIVSSTDSLYNYYLKTSRNKNYKMIVKDKYYNITSYLYKRTKDLHN